MPSTKWSAKRKRQYEHIKEGVLRRGESGSLAEEIAARSVNKERAEHGESITGSASSVDDIASGRQDGISSHEGTGWRTLAQLRDEAGQRGINWRSSMNKPQLLQALQR